MEKLSKIETLDEYLLRWTHNLPNGPQYLILIGMKSKILPVTSGVSQGSVLGPVVFLVFIIDLPEEVDCQVALFIDNTLMYRLLNARLAL